MISLSFATPQYQTCTKLHPHRLHSSLVHYAILGGGVIERQTARKMPCFSAQKFDFRETCRYDSGMIAMANPFADYMTVQEVMRAIKARSHSTVLRLVYDEDKTAIAPGDRPLAGIKIPGHGWMIRRTAVAAFLESESRRKPGVGFPRGRTRAEPAPKSPLEACRQRHPPGKKSR